MTNAQFNEIVEILFGTTARASRALGFDRDTITAARKGKTKKGADFPVPLRMELAVAGWRSQQRRVVGGEAAAKSGEIRSEVEVFTDKPRAITLELWFPEDAARLRKLIAEWPPAAAIVISVVMGSPARVAGSDWVAAQ